MVSECRDEAGVGGSLLFSIPNSISERDARAAALLLAEGGGRSLSVHESAQ